MNSKKIISLLMSTLLLTGISLSSNYTTTIYGDEAKELVAESSDDETLKELTNDSKVEDQNNKENLEETIDYINNEDDLEKTIDDTNKECSTEENSISNLAEETDSYIENKKSEDSKLEQKNTEDIDAEEEETEELMQYGVSVQRKTGKEDKSDFTTERVTYYDTVHVKNYSNNNNNFIDEGAYIDTNDSLTITFDADIDFDTTCDKAYIKAYGENADSEVELNISNISSDRKESKIIATIDSSELKKLSLGRNTLVMEFDRVRSSVYMRATYYSIRHYISYLDINIQEPDVKESKFNIEDGVITKLNMSDEEKANLDTVVIPNEINGQTVKAIGSNVFKNCSNLKDVQISSTVESIGESAFEECKKLSSVKMGSSVKSIGKAAFKQCRELTKLYIPEGVTEISDELCLGCKELREVRLPSSLTKINTAAFKDCVYLQNVDIPNGVATIGNQAFYNCCYKLDTVNLPASVVNLGEEAFSKCYFLTTLFIPFKCEFNTNTFYYDYMLDNIFVSGGTSPQRSYIKEKVKKSKDNEEALPLPVDEIVAEFEDGASENASIDNSLFTVENGVIKKLNCLDSDKSKLLSIKIPEYIDGTKITGIGDSLFSGCTSLSKVEIPNSIEKIYNAAFIGCTSLENIIIPESVNEIGDACFAGCNKLETIKVPSTLTKLSSYVFNGCFNLKNINMPENLKEIGEMTFYNCWNLDNITFFDKLQSIGNSAFTGCINLKNISIPDSVTYMGNGVFEECKNIQSVKLPKNITTIGEKMFKNCSNLETIKLPHNMLSIGNGAFYGCPKINSITIQ